jgi:DNA-binding CsgD family transcriptional regulator
MQDLPHGTAVQAPLGPGTKETDAASGVTDGPKCYTVIRPDPEGVDPSDWMRHCQLLQTSLELRDQEISRLQQELRKEAEARRLAQKTAREQAQALEAGASRLQETTTALKVLIAEAEAQRRVAEERVVCNANALIRPVLSKLLSGRLTQRQRALLDAIAQGLDDITSPLSRRFIIESRRLSPAEIKVAGLIRQGRSTKEIATLLGVAGSTIDFHRLNIRRKLQLKDRAIHLQSHLKSLV